MTPLCICDLGEREDVRYKLTMTTTRLDIWHLGAGTLRLTWMYARFLLLISQRSSNEFLENLQFQKFLIAISVCSNGI